MAVTAPTTAVALPPAPDLTRPRTLLVGTSFATVAMLMAFSALFARYLDLRAATLGSGRTWIEPGTIPLVPGGMMMATMAMSLVSAAWAWYAIAHDDRSHTVIALLLTGLFGAAVINQTAFLYGEMGLAIDDSPAALMIYVITGAHLLAIAVGMIFFALMAFRAIAGQYSSRQSDGIGAAVIFWYAVVAVYAVIWYAIYITK
jgi:heme/copper-type cytochrome/quinol oxidase subunit 3